MYNVEVNTTLPESPKPTEPEEQQSDSLQAHYTSFRRLVVKTNNPRLKRFFANLFLHIASSAGTDGSMGRPQDGNITD